METPASYPNFAGKHAHEPLATPAANVAWQRAQGFIPDDLFVPDAAILTYQPQVLRQVRRDEPTTPWAYRRMMGEVELLDRCEGRVAVVGGFGFGAPVAAVVLESLIAMGVRRFISMGTAGGLQPSQAIGDVVLCDAAVRDEGVSHHYEAPARWARPDAGLTDRLGEALTAADVAHRRGGAWTIDTPYRETAEEVRHYRDDGVACVEMEAAALFTVAAHRGVAIASAFAVSDLVRPEGWQPAFTAPELRGRLWQLLQISVAALDRP